MWLVEKLNQANLSYAVCGGIAVTLHGFVRATDDIDLMALPFDISNIKKIARSVGFRVQNPEPLIFGKGTPRETTIHRVSKRHGDDSLLLDIPEVNEFNRNAWTSRRAHKLDGMVVWAIGRNALLAMKRQSARPKDLIDLQGLEGQLEN